MRVIAGTAKGTRLKAPSGLSVRPTADRVKEALFSIIGSRLVGSLFLDLYAGSGAIGIEALSRGARSCIFVDDKKRNQTLIKENLIKTKLDGKARLIMLDVKKALVLLSREEVKADLVYLDPPYDSPDLAFVIKRVFELKIIADNGLVIAEHAYSDNNWAASIAKNRQRKYGDTCLTIFQN